MRTTERCSVHRNTHTHAHTTKWEKEKIVLCFILLSNFIAYQLRCVCVCSFRWAHEIGNKVEIELAIIQRNQARTNEFEHIWCVLAARALVRKLHSHSHCGHITNGQIPYSIIILIRQTEHKEQLLLFMIFHHMFIFTKNNNKQNRLAVSVPYVWAHIRVYIYKIAL